LEDYFDCCFIDCPPQLGTLLFNALVAADEVIIPVKTEYLAYRGLQALLDTIEGIQSGDGDRSLNPDLVLLGAIGTMYEKSVNDHRDVLTLLEQKVNVLGVVKKAAVVNKAIIDGKPVVLSGKGTDVSKAYIEIALNINE
jgi:chromosome partitioning protein